MNYSKFQSFKCIDNLILYHETNQKKFTSQEYRPIADLVNVQSQVPTRDLDQIDPYYVSKSSGSHTPQNQGLTFWFHNPHRGMETVTFIVESRYRKHKDSRVDMNLSFCGGVHNIWPLEGVVNFTQKFQQCKIFKKNGEELADLLTSLVKNLRLKKITEPGFWDCHRTGNKYLISDSGKVKVQLTLELGWSYWFILRQSFPLTMSNNLF